MEPERETLKENLRRKAKNYDYKKKAISTFGSFPRSLKGYNFRIFLGDLIAGITVCKLITTQIIKCFWKIIQIMFCCKHAEKLFSAMLKIPQAMAYALLAGAKPQLGWKITIVTMNIAI